MANVEAFMDEELSDEDIDILEIILVGFPRSIYTRQNYFDSMDNMRFFQRFRLTKDTVLRLVEIFEEQLEYPHDRNNSVSPVNQLLLCLRFYASNGFLNTIGDFSGVHYSTSSRIIAKVSRTIASLNEHFIRMPRRVEIPAEQQNFREIANYPRLLGTLDGTHIRIQNPGGYDGEIFRNRKNYFSINVQVVGNSDLKICDIVARWPGSAHDSTIFNNSNVKRRFENGDFGTALLLGDSAYPLRRYLMTPILNPNPEAQQRYNRSHITTRNSIERLFGVWKRRFPVLAYGCRLKLETTLTTIVACAVLHNFPREMHEYEPPAPEDINQQELENLIQDGQINANNQHHHGYGEARGIRNNIVNNYF